MKITKEFKEQALGLVKKYTPKVLSPNKFHNFMDIKLHLIKEELEDIYLKKREDK